MRYGMQERSTQSPAVTALQTKIIMIHCTMVSPANSQEASPQIPVGANTEGSHSSSLNQEGKSAKKPQVSAKGSSLVSS